MQGVCAQRAALVSAALPEEHAHTIHPQALLNFNVPVTEPLYVSADWARTSPEKAELVLKKLLVFKVRTDSCVCSHPCTLEVTQLVLSCLGSFTLLKHSPMLPNSHRHPCCFQLIAMVQCTLRAGAPNTQKTQDACTRALSCNI